MPTESYQLSQRAHSGMNLKSDWYGKTNTYQMKPFILPD